MIALVGDFSSDVVAHRAIPPALELASGHTNAPAPWRWVATESIRDAARDLAGFSAIWLVPGSPYRNTSGALEAVRFARETARPFLGTCGGFQHALIEIARDVAGIADAAHAETSSGDAGSLVVTALACSLVEQSGEVVFTPGSRLWEIFRGRPARGEYHCRYGVNPSYRAALEHAGLRFTGFDAGGDIRALELPGHPFFCGTLFQPERSALRGERHPLVEAFVQAAASTDAAARVAAADPLARGESRASTAPRGDDDLRPA